MKLFNFIVISLCAFVLSFVITGCSYKTISHGSEISDDLVSAIVDGKTTKENIFIQFGNPSKTMENDRVFFYNWTRGSKGSFFGLGGGSAYTQSLVIVFDEKGVVKSHRVTRGATEGGTMVGD